MDKKKDCRIPKCGSLPPRPEGKLVVGTKQLKKAVESGRARCVFLAEDADPAITGLIEQMCSRRNIQITWISSMSELGRACGIEVGAAAAAVVRESGSIGENP